MIYTETDGRNFVILVDEKPVLFHSPSSPFLSVCEDGSLMNRFLGHIPIRAAQRHYTALDNVSYDPELGLLRFYHGSRSVSFSVKESGKGALQLSPMKLSHSFAHLRFHFATSQDEPIFGCGGNTVSPNLRGRHINIRGGCGTAGGDMPHPIEILGKYSGGSDVNAPVFAIPSFFTGSLFFCSFWFGGASNFDFTHRSYITADFAGIPEKIVLGKAETVKEVHSHQAELYGKRCSLPVWYQSGIIAGISGGYEMLLEALETFKKAEIPVSSLYIRDWTGSRRIGHSEVEFWDWVWNREYYPHLDEVIRELSDHNINTLCYINPHLAMEGRLYAEASKNGYLIKDSDGTNLLSDMGGFMAGHIDLTNQKACQWIRQILVDNVFSLGFSGVITDMMHFLPANSVLNGNTTPAKVYNYWPALWTKIVRSAAEQCGIDPVCIIDSGSIGCSASLISANGSRVDWLHGHGLKSALSEMLSLGLSGAGPAHCDFGAYAHLIPQSLVTEQLIRWAEFATFTPAMRTHTLPRSSPAFYQNNRDALFQLSRFSKLRYHLAPYINHCIEEYLIDKIPPMRHMWEVFPNMDRSQDISDQYMLGSELLVAPVVIAGQTSRQVVFPEFETWVHLFSGNVYEPGIRKVDAPLGSPPVFYKKGGSHEAIFASLAYKTL